MRPSPAPMLLLLATMLIWRHGFCRLNFHQLRSHLLNELLPSGKRGAIRSLREVRGFDMASDLATTLTAAPLSPSERVLLYGERFTTAQILLGTTNDPQVPLLHADVTVSSPQLGRAILLAAILASGEAGTIVLAPRVKKQLFGLSSTDSLYADAGPEQKVIWPSQSLEARIRPTVDQLQPNDDNDVATVVTTLVPPAEDPWASAVGQVIEGLR